MPAQSNVSALRSVYHRIISLLLQEPSATDEEMAALFREKEEISRAIDPDHYANFVDTAALSIDAIKTELIKLNGRTGKLEDRLEKVEGRLDKVEGRLDKVEGRLAKVERRLEDLWDAFKNFERDYDASQTARRCNGRMRGFNRRKNPDQVLKRLMKEARKHDGPMPLWLAQLLDGDEEYATDYPVGCKCPRKLHAKFVENPETESHQICDAFAWFYNESFGDEDDDVAFRRELINNFLCHGSCYF
eukprot:TRINITY_DN12632_c4_g1_i1.p3 TRINITY_DN12632_c4_g1~~TRINITY_DN12632_c4_g1_i1.p3  ORF type:complete len:246 (+),score=57.89 TRINITY_DN12632_c4_g1_i1:1758-2495(+)